MKYQHQRMQRTIPNVLTLGLIFGALGLAPAQAQKHGPHHGAKKSPAKPSRQSKRSQAKAAVHYSCPMHPTVRGKAGGECPKCGMDLRAVRNDEAAETVAASNDADASISNTPSVEESAEQTSKLNIPDTELLDQDGRKIHFYTDLVKGRTVAINFIFTTCTTICPPLGATFARVQKELGDKVGRDVHFISISVDPATDTPERLKAWGAKFRAGDGWTFVTGNKPQVDELLRALGASSARREDHSPTVLVGNDARGNWTRTYGLAKPSQLVQIINDAVAGKTAAAAEASN